MMIPIVTLAIGTLRSRSRARPVVADYVLRAAPQASLSGSDFMDVFPKSSRLIARCLRWKALSVGTDGVATGFAFGATVPTDA